MPEVSITTEFGDYIISFEEDDDLTVALGRMRDHILTVNSSTRDLRPQTGREPKPGLELSYRFTPRGEVELLTFPSQLLRRVVLALYAYHPEMVTAPELAVVTAIEDVDGRVLRQTNNQRYFRTQGDVFGLSNDGVRYFEERVLPDLPSPSEADSAGNAE